MAYKLLWLRGLGRFTAIQAKNAKDFFAFSAGGDVLRLSVEVKWCGDEMFRTLGMD